MAILDASAVFGSLDVARFCYEEQMRAPVSARSIAAQGSAQFDGTCLKLLLSGDIAGIVSMQLADGHAISPLSPSLLDGAFW